LKATGKLAVTMAAQGELAEARQLQEEVVAGMRALDGETGRDTLRAINNLAGTIAAQGDLGAARELLQSVIAAIIDEYGEQHPDCLAAMGNLAGVLWQEGDHAEAYELQRQVVELYRRVDGAGDRTTLAAAAVLETMERDGGF
jgi:eukaryotic-like serine/threonine-protein kinase